MIGPTARNPNLRKFYLAQGGDEALFDLTPGTKKAIEWRRDRQASEFQALFRALGDELSAAGAGAGDVRAGGGLGGRDGRSG